MLTDLEFFIATLPDWDGKDRVSELEELVKAGLTIYIDRNVYISNWVEVSIIHTCVRGKDIIINGDQGIGKSTLTRFLFPFEKTEVPPQCKGDIGIATIENGASFIETEDVSMLPASKYGLPILNIESIDYSYTGIDIEQLYAQVLAEQKKQHKR